MRRTTRTAPPPRSRSRPEERPCERRSAERSKSLPAAGDADARLGWNPGGPARARTMRRLDPVEGPSGGASLETGAAKKPRSECEMRGGSDRPLGRNPVDPPGEFRGLRRVAHSHAADLQMSSRNSAAAPAEEIKKKGGVIATSSPRSGGG